MNEPHKIALLGWLFLLGMAASAGATPLPPPGCGEFCGTITLIKDPTAGIPFDAPERALSSPWVSYQLDLHMPFPHAQALASDVVINAQLHQRWPDSNGDGIFEPSANDTDNSAGDSHLLAPAGSRFGAGPVEDNSGNGSPLADTPMHDYGVGTTLTGAWAIPNPATFTNLAYNVVPKGSPLDINVRIAFTAIDPGGTLTTSDFIFIPEPGTMTLTALAVFGLASITRCRTSQSRR